MLISPKNKGFTVLEVLVALGVLTSFSPVITSSINYVIKSDKKYELVKNGIFFLESISKEFKYNLSNEELSFIEDRFGSEFYVDIKEVALDKHLENNILDLIDVFNADLNNFIKVTLNDNKINVLVELNNNFDKFVDFIEFEREDK